MKKIQGKSYGYVLLTISLTLIFAWAGTITWQELRQLHRSFSSVQADLFHLSDHIAISVDDLNDIVQRSNLPDHPDDPATFDRKCQELQQWILTRQSAANTGPERELVSQIAAAFDLYCAQSARLVHQPAQSGNEAALRQMNEKSAAIVELCDQLRSTERTAQTQFMKDSRSALAWLQELLAVQMGLLVFLVVTGLVAVYRGVIGPLRIELGQSRAYAARQEKLASLGTLAAGVAHEIRNPLTAINVRLHSLKKNLVPASSEQEDALVIGHEIQRLEHIVQEFLQFARPADPKLITISADSLLARIRSLFAPQFEKTSIRLNLESIPDVWVHLDPYQIEQVLINLIQNAAESMPKGGTITVRARVGNARLHGRSGPVVILEVTDTGVGIPPEVQKRMFDPFFTTKEEGTGLGLAISARIIEKHGGSIECHSELDHGTSFVILLPHTQPQSPDEFAN